MSPQPWSTDEAFERAPAALAIVDGTDGAVLAANRSLAERLGVDADDLCGLAWPSPLGGTRRDFSSILDALGDADAAVVETRLGERIDPVWWRQSVTRVWAEGEQPYLIVHVEDRSYEHRTLDDLVRVADHDELTGLWNRRRFRRELHSALSGGAGSVGSVGSVGLLLFDVDGFKEVNDTFGHSTGDAALTAVAASLRGAAPAGAAAARLSGDEFAVLLRADTADIATERCRALAAATRRVVVGENAPEVRLSAGWAVAEPGPDADRRVHDLMIEADVAMYADKARARAQRTPPFGPTTDEVPAPTTWPPDSIVQESGFELWAHPVVLVAGGDVVLHDVSLRGPKVPVTLGALVRMLEMVERHARRGVGQPSRYVIHLHDFPLGVGSAVKWLGRAAADAGLQPGSVTFALPEVRLVEDGRSTHQVLTSLRDEGLGLAVDSFGAEIGSLRLLADLVPDQVWFDHRLLRSAADGGPADDPGSRAIALDLVPPAVAMAQRIGALTGVGRARPEDLDLLAGLGIDLALVRDPSAFRPVGVVALEGSLEPVSAVAGPPPEEGSTRGS